MISGCIESLERRPVGVQVLEKLKEEGNDITNYVESKINDVLDKYNWSVTLSGGKIYAQSHDKNEIYNKVKQKLGVLNG